MVRAMPEVSGTSTLVKPVGVVKGLMAEKATTADAGC
jgi:hypothetical protein